MPIEKEKLNMLDLGRKPFQFCFFYIEISKNHKEYVFPLCDGLRLFLSMALSIAITHNHSSVGTPLEG